MYYLTPSEEIALHAIKHLNCHTVTDLMKFMKTNGPNQIHSTLSNLTRQGKIIKSNCPTCNKVGYYE